MVLYVIGLGLGDERDITLRGLDAIRACDFCYLEHYTSVFAGLDKARLEALYGKPVILAGKFCLN
jgi:diphthine synthase